MKTITVTLSNRDFERLTGKAEKINFKTLRKQVLADAFRQSLNDTVREARKSGLNRMTLAEIDAEIRAVREQRG
jgi:hypothetical protein